MSIDLILGSPPQHTHDDADWPRLLTSARRIVAARARGFSREDHEDLVQEVLLSYTRTWSGGAGPRNADAWLETVISRAVVDLARARGRRVQEVVAREDDPVEEFARRLRGSASTSLLPLREKFLRQVFRLVSAEDAEILRLRILDDLPSAEVAQQLGVTTSAVDQRLSRAKRRLRGGLRSRPDLLDELRLGHPRHYPEG